MAKKKSREEYDHADLAAMVSRVMSDLNDDPVRMKRRLAAGLEALARVKELEMEHDDARQVYDQIRKKLNGAKEECWRIMWNGPDPQCVMPFAAGEEGAGDDVNGEAVSAPAKAKRVRNRTKDGAPATKRVRKR